MIKFWKIYNHIFKCQKMTKKEILNRFAHAKFPFSGFFRKLCGQKIIISFFFGQFLTLKILGIKSEISHFENIRTQPQF